MNLLHYPSLELCKKLTEIGFPKTERWYILKGEISWIQGIELTTTQSEKKQVCPNVMEMLDVIPERIEHEGYSFSLSIFNLLDKKIFMRYISQGCEMNEEIGKKVEYDKRVAKINGTLPNALAEMVLWLVENKHLSFNK